MGHDALHHENFEAEAEAASQTRGQRAREAIPLITEATRHDAIATPAILNCATRPCETVHFARWQLLSTPPSCSSNHICLDLTLHDLICLLDSH